MHSPAWWVDQTAWESAGGRTVGTTGASKTSLGEVQVGLGRVRILGSLLPDPSGDAAHPFGVSDYAATYAGYQLFENLLGASAHLTAQIAEAQGAAVHVVTRAPQAQRLALELGAEWAGGLDDAPPEPLDAAILFAPVGNLVLPALAALDRGATLAIAGIHLTDVPVLSYERHLFEERSVTSVTANTRADGEELLRLAAHIRPRVETVPYPLERAADALNDVLNRKVKGKVVLLTGE